MRPVTALILIQLKGDSVMVVGLFTAMFFLSLTMLIIQTIFFKRNISPYYSLLFAAVTVSNLGYLQLVTAESLEAALTANQVVYLGASFLPFLSFACVCDLCQIKQRMKLNIPCIIIACTVYAGVMSVGNSEIYYKSVQLAEGNGYSYLVKEYGPLHILFPVYMFSLMAAAIGIILHSFKKKKQISYIVSTVLTVIMTLQLIVYILERALNSKIDLLPFAFVLAQTGILFLLDRIRLYDVPAISGQSMTDSYDYGFVICSSDLRLAGTDAAARSWFPELNDLNIDYVIKRNDTKFLKQLHKWVNSSDKKGSALFKVNDSVVEARYSVINEKKKALHYISLRDDTAHQKYADLIKSYNSDLKKDVTLKTNQLKRVMNDIIFSLANIVEDRDNNTGGHIQRTSDVVAIFVKHLTEKKIYKSLDAKTAECVIKAAPLHDFGKIAIPDIILNKPGRFTDEEYEEMKKHSEKGARIVAKILKHSTDMQFRTIAVHIARSHHEKWNGMGYPQGLKGVNIPFEARIMALADVFDALVSKRVYKESMDFDQAFAIIEESSGSHFDPTLCHEFLQCRPEFEKLYASYE